MDQLARGVVHGIDDPTPGGIFLRSRCRCAAVLAPISAFERDEHQSVTSNTAITRAGHIRVDASAILHKTVSVYTYKTTAMIPYPQTVLAKLWICTEIQTRASAFHRSIPYSLPAVI